MPSSSSKRQRVPQNMMVQPFMPQHMMMPQMFTPQQMAALHQAHQEQLSSEEEQAAPEQPPQTETIVPKEETRQALPEKGMEGFPVKDRLPTSLTLIRGMGKARLSEAMEWISPQLEATMTHQLSNKGLLALLFCCTRLRPTTRVCDLRC